MLNLSNIAMENESALNRKDIKRVRSVVKINHGYSTDLRCDSCDKLIRVKSHYCEIVRGTKDPDSNITDIKFYRFCKKCSGEVLEKIGE